jgi:hypothetical protein
VRGSDLTPGAFITHLQSGKIGRRNRREAVFLFGLNSSEWRGIFTRCLPAPLPAALVDRRPDSALHSKGQRRADVINS